MRYFLLLFLLISFNAFSQSISGVVMDGEFNEPLPFANVLVKGTKIGSTTDIDGKFQIKVEAGTYTVVFSFIGYSTVEISEVIVKANKDTFLQVTLKSSSNQLNEVVVTTTSKKNSEASVLNIQKKSISLLDGLSIQAIKNAGDSDVAGAIKRVPGISVQGGKYIYVRGLGDRYSKTTLNGMELPGLDPDRNTIPMDIFPTNLIENIIVKKSASSEIGADFTGGTVDINLKDFSFSPEYTVNFTAGYNPDMHFNNNFIADARSSTDWRGKDSGLRSLTIDPNLDFPPALPLPLIPAERAAILTDNTKKLNKVMAPNQERSDLNYSFGFSASNGYKLKKDGESTIGFIAAIGYKSETTFLPDFFRSNVFRSPEQGILQELTQNSSVGTVNNFLSSLLGVTYKDSKNKITFNFIDLQNGESNASNLTREAFIENPHVGEGSIITYTERNLRSFPFSGKHTIGDNLFTVNWNFAKSTSTLNDKDFRRTIFEIIDGNYQISPNVIGNPTRLWRDLDEEGTVSKLDIEFPIKANNFSGKISLGASSINKQRDFSSKRFDILFNGNSQVLGGDPNAVLADENIWVQSDRNFIRTDGSYIKGGFERTNRYNSESKNDAIYFSTELKFSEKVKAVLGTRFETYQLRYTGEDLLGNQFENDLFLDDKDLFTNLNLIISPNDKSNIRLAYYNTTARPTFKEASSAYLIDPVTETFFLGNPDIKSSYIDNYDLRYEYFGEKNQMFALSLFAKSFKDPIETAVVSDDTPNDFTVINNDKASVMGVELEMRKNILTFNNINLNLTTNASFIRAKQTMNDDEYNTRLLLAEPGQVIDRERELQGQSPYLINIGLLANHSEKEIQAGIFYNVQGPTLEFVGAGGVPDIYSEPFHNLDFTASKVFNGDKVSKKFSLRVKNLLQDKIESNYIWNEENVGFFRSFAPGMTFTLGVTLTFK